jgi:hypothetical protein
LLVDESRIYTGMYKSNLTSQNKNKWMVNLFKEVENVTMIKTCLASLEGIEASLSILALQTIQKESADDLHAAMLLVGEIVTDIKKKVETMD